MPGITEEMFYQGAITADYEQVKRMTETISDMLTKAKTARIVKEGCELTIQLSGRNGVISSGVYRNPGESGNLPSGEAYIAPLETQSEGEMIIDGTMVGIGRLSSPLHVTVREGKLVAIEGERAKRSASFWKRPRTPRSVSWASARTKRRCCAASRSRTRRSTARFTLLSARTHPSAASTRRHATWTASS